MHVLKYENFPNKSKQTNPHLPPGCCQALTYEFRSVMQTAKVRPLSLARSLTLSVFTETINVNVFLLSLLSSLLIAQALLQKGGSVVI